MVYFSLLVRYITSQFRCEDKQTWRTVSVRVVIFKRYIAFSVTYAFKDKMVYCRFDKIFWGTFCQCFRRLFSNI